MFKRIISVLMVMTLLLGALASFSLFAEGEKKLTLEKTAFEVGEPITVSAVGDGKDWVGIYLPGEPHSIRWTYIDSANGGVGSGVSFDMRTVGEKNDGAQDEITAGTYIIRLMPDDTSELSRALDEIEITVGDPDAQKPLVSGDATRLSIEKNTFAYNEPINISAVGSGTDWVGIYSPGEPHSIRWTYIDSANNGVGSGVTFNMRTVGELNEGAPATLPAGNYMIRLMPNDSTNTSEAIAWASITIEEESTAGKSLKAPEEAAYVLKNNTDGFAEGTLTVKVGDDNTAADIVCYWADDNGRLEGYTALAKFKVTGQSTVREWGKNVLIPTGATKLHVYGAKNGKLSADYVSIDLPDGASSKDYGKPIVEFQVVSDIHLNTDARHAYNKNFKALFEDIVKNSPESLGLFVAGDIADSGNALEYKQLASIHASVAGAPKYYLAIGNHDLYNGTLKEKTDLFLKYAQYPDGSHPESSHYDFWLDGYHFVFLGNDQLINGLNVTLNRETLSWLDSTLAKDRDEGRPTFLFLHQSLYDTVSGSLPGQNWNGVASESGLRRVLKKYPEVIMFNGHSHWTLDSESCMYVRSDELPTIFNTASGAYLWTSYNKVGGENLPGSQGYYIRVYEDKVLVLGRDFKTGEWVPSAQFCVEYEGGKGAATVKVTFDNGGKGNDIEPVVLNLGGTLTLPETPEHFGFVFEGWYTDPSFTEESRIEDGAPVNADITLYAKWSPDPEIYGDKDDGGLNLGKIGVWVLLVLGAVVITVPFIVVILVIVNFVKNKKKKK